MKLLLWSSSCPVIARPWPAR